MSLRTPTALGLPTGALGIALLWAAGVDFPVYPPPGLVILGVGAAFVTLAPWRWVTGVGAFLGLFILVGFVPSSINSGAGTDNLAGDEGVLGSVGTVIQLVGAATALAVGVAATRLAYARE